MHKKAFEQTRLLAEIYVKTRWTPMDGKESQSKLKKKIVFRARLSEYATVGFRAIVYKTPAAIEKQEKNPDAIFWT